MELPGRLTPISTIPGDIADYDGTRLLYVAHDAPAGEHYSQVYRRDPQGTISRITNFETAGLLERLAPNGDAMVYRRGERMLSRGTGLTTISGSLFDSRSYWFDGQWYIAMGATLVSVDTSGL